MVPFSPFFKEAYGRSTYVSKLEIFTRLDFWKCSQFEIKLLVHS